MIAQLNDLSEIWWQWMGSMFWQVSLLIIIVTALDMVIRKWAWPQVRYALWALVFIKLIISPAWQMPTSIVSWIQPQVEERIAVQIGISDEAAKSAEALLFQDDLKETAAIRRQETLLPSNDNKQVMTEAATWKTWLLSCWISGMIIFSLLLFRKVIEFRKWRKIQAKDDIPEWQNKLLLSICKRLKLKKTPTLVFSKDLKSPAVYGVIKQFLILPEGYMDKLSREQAEHVLIHELCHLKRGDLLVHWICILLQIVYWFNPLLIWSRKQMRHICEICCDLSVANVLREKTADYRATLLKTARELFAESMEPGIGFLGIFESPFRLIPRLKWLEKRSWENPKRKIIATISISLFMVICIMPMAGISQVSDYSSDEADLQQGQGEIITFPYNFVYKGLIVEADEEKAFDFGSVTDSGFHTFNDGITVDGKPFEDLKELKLFMNEDPDVQVLGSPEVYMGGVHPIDILKSGKGSDKTYCQRIKISPEMVNEKMVKLDIELEVVEANEGDSAKKKVNYFYTDLILEDEKTSLVTFKGKTNIYFFITADISKKDLSNYTKKTDLPLTYDQEPEGQKSGRYPEFVTLNFKNADFNEIMTYLSKITGKGFSWFPPDVPQKITLVSPENITVDEALKVFESAVDELGCRLVDRVIGIDIRRKDAVVSIEFVNTDIREINNYIQGRGWKKIIIDDSVEGEIDINTQGEVTFDEAYDLFQSKLEEEGYTAIQQGDYFRIIKE